MPTLSWTRSSTLLTNPKITTLSNWPNCPTVSPTTTTTSIAITWSYSTNQCFRMKNSKKTFQGIAKTLKSSPPKSYPLLRNSIKTNHLYTKSITIETHRITSRPMLWAWYQCLNMQTFWTVGELHCYLRGSREIGLPWAADHPYSSVLTSNAVISIKSTSDNLISTIWFYRMISIQKATISGFSSVSEVCPKTLLSNSISSTCPKDSLSFNTAWNLPSSLWWNPKKGRSDGWEMVLK